MVTINTTFHIEEESNDDFIDYMKHIYMAGAVLDESMIESRFYKIHAHQLEKGISYSVQFVFNNLEDLDNWDKTRGAKLNEALLTKFKENIAGFSTLLEEIKL